MKILGIGVVIVYVIGIVTKYRVTKIIDGDTLNPYNALNMFYLGYNAETSLTIYNLMSSVEQSLKGNDFFFFPEIKDFVVMMIPSFWFSEKADYLSFVSFDNEFNVAPFGTYFVVGELILSLRYKFLFVVFAFFVNLFSHYFYLKFLIKTNFVKMVAYTFGLSILFFSPVRGLIAPAVKIFITFVASIYFLNKLTFRQSKYIENYEENKN
ncbi:hypothetical protein [Capnocytophaga canis]|uniref:hypothetical protein n=1 Tax=Capnocytophaga canis TaxID=1848903 RepID=UPI001BB421D7|nr:hypothetical protein [Capnocytophaga canis]